MGGVGGTGGAPDEIGPGMLLSGRYRLEEQLGGGGFGQVYAALDEGLGRRVAVKVLTLRAEWAEHERMERQGRFRREALAAAALGHPNVATVHDAGEHDGRPFLVMELLAGRDFGQVLLERGGLPVADVLAYGAQIAAGLQHAHEHGLVHRDVKPENLMLLPGGVVKICDFGLVAQRDPEPARFTDPHAVMGSPPYLSPEQAQGREVTAQSDLYSLGCVLYALLAEGPPFSAGNVIGYAYAHVHEAPERIERRRTEVTADLAHLVHGLLAKDPADRPATAREVEGRLRALQHPSPAPRTPTALDSGTRQVVWALLEEGEGLLAAGRFADADRRYWQALQQLARQGAETAPASFAALFGRARALEGLNGVPSVARRLAELAREASVSLGAEHPVARCVASYAAVRAAPER
ncbi:serine/threonine protein kinase [Actinacidiphila yanglinensis]|uniref:non-specific serine/threonine protein kinase n=1 Tax=Actinacidiphila yanglinensis TaxID=310779 RepID=A0A1H5WZT4_9ACTN|nr:serine/threonine-protein kinase [Actinacidiphila yanglinensis]SEG04991.1 serine/threonine protein kinase [Actinacidiphila yanglinensis]